MADAYSGFGQGLLVVAALGALLTWLWPRVGVRAMDRVAALVTIVGLVTSAALVSVAFLADRLSETGALLPFSGSLSTATGMTGAVLLFGGSGLLCASVGVIVGRGWARRWAGSCLAVSCLLVLLLLPGPIVLIFESAAATPVG